MDLSNKSLALLLLAAVVISLGGTIVSLNKLSDFQTGTSQELGITGRASDSGQTQLNIQDFAGCTVDSNVNFGSGSAANINITTDADNSPTGFTDCSNGALTNNCTGMQVNNTGNVDLTVNMSSSDNATGFLGGGSATVNDFMFYMRNGTYTGAQGGCYNNTGADGWGATPGDTQSTVLQTQKKICSNLTPTDVNDIVTLEYNVTLRDSTPSGQKTATITVTCNQI